MEKGFSAVVLILALFATVGLVQAEETTPIDRLVIDFHSIGGGEHIDIDLPRYFGRMADFVVKPTIHVNVTIDKKTGMASMQAYDPEWRGIEEVIFAVSVEALEKTAAKTKRYEPIRRRNYTKLNVSSDKIALISDAFTQQEYETIVGNLTGEPIVIVSSIANGSMSLDINEELTINFSFGPERTSPLPGIDINFRIKETNLTRPYYSEPNQLLFFTLVLVGIGAIIVISLYVYYSFGAPLKSIFLAPKKRVIASKAPTYVPAMIERLKYMRKQIGRDKPSKLYRETLLLMNKFLLKAYGVKGMDKAAIEKKLEHYGVSGSTKDKISVYLTEYRDKMYSASEITDDDVEGLIEFLESIVRGM